MLLVKASHYSAAPVAVIPAFQVSTNNYAPPPTFPSDTPFIHPVVSSTTTVPASGKKPVSTVAKPKPAASTTSTTDTTTTTTSVASPSTSATTLPQLSATVTAPVSTTTTTVAPPTLATWFSVHGSQVDALQAADLNLWNVSVSDVSQGPQANLTAAIAQLQLCLSNIQHVLPTNPDPALAAALTTLGQSAQDFVDWQKDPAGVGFHDGVGALSSGDAALFQALVGAGVPADKLRATL